MKKVILILALFFAIGMQANNETTEPLINNKITEVSLEGYQWTRYEMPLKVDFIFPISLDNWCTWNAAVYVSNHTYETEAERNAAFTGYYDACMEYGGNHG